MSPDSPLPSVCVLVDGQEVVLRPGDVIGRSPVATLRFDDPRVSEMHAYLSNRSGKLMLLGLRGRIGLDGKVYESVELAPDQEVLLAPGLSMRVTAVTIPNRVLTLTGTGLARQTVPGTCSLLLDPEPTLAPGARRGALLQLWPQGDGWRARRDGQDVDVEHGHTWRFGELEFVARWSRTAAPSPTESSDALGAPLRIVAHFDTVHIYRGSRSVVRLTGKQARLLSELVAFDGPTPWTVLVGEVWGKQRPASTLRAVLDVTVTRLRKRLAVAGVRSDLVAADGCGNFELVLAPGDRVEGSV